METSPLHLPIVSLDRAGNPTIAKTRVRRAVILAVSAAALIQSPAFASNLIKLQDTNALNTASAWNNTDDEDGIPDANDTLVWDNTFTTPVNPRTVGALSALGGDLAVFGIRIADVGGTRNAGTTAVGFQNASSANTLTIGAGGIDMLSATQAFTFESKIALSANQDWLIGNANTNGNPTGFNNGEDLALRAQNGSTTSASTSFNLGGFTVNTSGAGAVTVSSGYAITNGTINIGNSLFLIGGGDSRLVTVGSDVNLSVASGSTLHFQSNSAGVTSAANITLNGGTLKLVNANAGNQVTIGGTTTVNSASTLQVGNNVGGSSTASTNGVLFNSNLVGSAPLTVTNNASTASVLVMGGNNSGYSGTLTFGGTSGRVTRLTTANSGSAAATWSISTGHTLQVNGVAVDLGTLNGAGTVSSSTGTATINVGTGNFSGTIINGSGTIGLTKSTSGTLTLTGANTYTGPTNVNAGTLLISPGTLSGTAVTVANGATFAVQGASSGILNTPSISLADSGTLLMRPLAAATTVTVPSVTAGTATGGTVLIDTTVLGNPTAAPLIASTFNPVAGTTIRVIGSNLTTGTFPAIGYSTLGGAGFAGLTLALPFRVAGSLVNNPNSIDVKITGNAKPVWRGGVNGNWDIDSTANGGAGTANWLATAGPNTYVESPTVGSDAVVFDDTATGTTNVNLTTTLTPSAVAVNNSARNYTLSGSGRLTGTALLTKSGTGTLTIANTGTNDYSGGTSITGGTVRVGDGVTIGAGTLGSGPVTMTSSGTLELNRPDDFDFTNSIGATGSLTKSQGNTANLPSALTFFGGITLNAGTLRLTNGGSLSGTLSGAGQLEAGGGTLAINGTTANTNTGMTTISAGTLQLNKTAGVQAIGGDITITGSGVLAILATEQIADTATITFTGTSTDSTAGSTSKETVANVIANPSTSAGQFQMRNGFTVTGTATLNNGVLGVSSGSTATVNAINMTGGILRIAGSTAASTLHVGAGGITASGGEIQVKFNTNNQDAVLNLGGNFTATGFVNITNGNYTGANLNVINLTGTRTFDIADGTFTTVAPDIAGPGGLVKTGTGTLSLNSSSAATYTGPTVIEAGTLSVAGTISGTPSITVKEGATFDVSALGLILGNGQSLRGTGSVQGHVSLDSGAKLEPGINAGTLRFGGDLDLTLAVTPNASAALAFELGAPGTSDKVAFDFGGLTIGTGVLDFGDFTFTKLAGFGAGEYTLFDGTSAIIGSLDTNAANLAGSLGGGYTGKLELRDGGNDLVLVIVPEPGSAGMLLAGLGSLLAVRRRTPVKSSRRNA
ncbi:beta strand repeat-containing protein [Verrucomicrobiota bacterium sgz303538]